MSVHRSPGSVTTLLAVTLAAAAVGALLSPMILAGGLAPLTVVALVALGLAAPLASRGSQAGLRDDGSAHALRRTVRTASVGAAVQLTLLTPLTALQGSQGRLALLACVAMIAAAAWWVSRPSATPRSTVGRLGVGLVVASLLPLGAVLVTSGLADGAWPAWGTPWALLTPRWDMWTEWLPGSLLLGLTLPVVADGLQTGRPLARDPQRVYSVVGIGLLFAAGLALVEGSLYAGLVSQPTLAAGVGPALIPASAVAGTALGAAVASVQADPEQPVRRGGLEILLWTAWFGLAGEAAARWMWLGVLPVALALHHLARSVRLHGVERAGSWLAAGLAFGAALWGFPGIPDATGAAAAAAATLVVLLWTAGWQRLTLEPV